ncbi:MAG: hypothetical protein A3J12_09690 [Omnitrophica bacterium RIFCSPLOWO2_02_FULL_44_11]|nr:MAG: hypothetical protein A3J12_09690 [Omnitrophica bacterium RIFCSPLOWO2_02_FULL_44_11]
MNVLFVSKSLSSRQIKKLKWYAEKIHPENPDILVLSGVERGKKMTRGLNRQTGGGFLALDKPEEAAVNEDEIQRLKRLQEKRPQNVFGFYWLFLNRAVEEAMKTPADFIVVDAEFSLGTQAEITAQWLENLKNETIQQRIRQRRLDKRTVSGKPEGRAEVRNLESNSNRLSTGTNESTFKLPKRSLKRAEARSPIADLAKKGQVANMFSEEDPSVVYLAAKKMKDAAGTVLAHRMSAIDKDLVGPVFGLVIETDEGQSFLIQRLAEGTFDENIQTREWIAVHTVQETRAGPETDDQSWTIISEQPQYLTTPEAIQNIRLGEHVQIAYQQKTEKNQAAIILTAPNSTDRRKLTIYSVEILPEGIQAVDSTADDAEAIDPYLYDFQDQEPGSAVVEERAPKRTVPDFSDTLAPKAKKAPRSFASAKKRIFRALKRIPFLFFVFLIGGSVVLSYFYIHSLETETMRGVTYQHLPFVASQIEWKDLTRERYLSNNPNSTVDDVLTSELAEPIRMLAQYNQQRWLQIYRIEIANAKVPVSQPAQTGNNFRVGATPVSNETKPALQIGVFHDRTLGEPNPPFPQETIVSLDPLDRKALHQFKVAVYGKPAAQYNLDFARQQKDAITYWTYFYLFAGVIIFAAGLVSEFVFRKSRIIRRENIRADRRERNAREFRQAEGHSGRTEGGERGRAEVRAAKNVFRLKVVVVPGLSRYREIEGHQVFTKPLADMTDEMRRKLNEWFKPFMGEGFYQFVTTTGMPDFIFLTKVQIVSGNVIKQTLEDESGAEPAEADQSYQLITFIPLTPFAVQQTGLFKTLVREYMKQANIKEPIYFLRSHVYRTTTPEVNIEQKEESREITITRSGHSSLVIEEMGRAEGRNLAPEKGTGILLKREQLPVPFSGKSELRHIENSSEFSVPSFRLGRMDQLETQFRAEARNEIAAELNPGLEAVFIRAPKNVLAGIVKELYPTDDARRTGFLNLIQNPEADHDRWLPVGHRLLLGWWREAPYAGTMVLTFDLRKLNAAQIREFKRKREGKHALEGDFWLYINRVIRRITGQSIELGGVESDDKTLSPEELLLRLKILEPTWTSGNIDALIHVGNFFRAKGDLGRAEFFLRKAAELLPENEDSFWRDQQAKKIINILTAAYENVATEYIKIGDRDSLQKARTLLDFVFYGLLNQYPLKDSVARVAGRYNQLVGILYHRDLRDAGDALKKEISLLRQYRVASRVPEQAKYVFGTTLKLIRAYWGESPSTWGLRTYQNRHEGAMRRRDDAIEWMKIAETLTGDPEFRAHMTDAQIRDFEKMKTYYGGLQGEFSWITNGDYGTPGHMMLEFRGAMHHQDIQAIQRRSPLVLKHIEYCRNNRTNRRLQPQERLIMREIRSFEKRHEWDDVNRSEDETRRSEAREESAEKRELPEEIQAAVELIRQAMESFQAGTKERERMKWAYQYFTELFQKGKLRIEIIEGYETFASKGSTDHDPMVIKVGAQNLASPEITARALIVGFYLLYLKPENKTEPVFKKTVIGKAKWLTEKTDFHFPKTPAEKSEEGALRAIGPQTVKELGELKDHLASIRSESAKEAARDARNVQVDPVMVQALQQFANESKGNLTEAWRLYAEILNEHLEHRQSEKLVQFLTQFLNTFLIVVAKRSTFQDLFLEVPESFAETLIDYFNSPAPGQGGIDDYRALLLESIRSINPDALDRFIGNKALLFGIAKMIESAEVSVKIARGKISSSRISATAAAGRQTLRELAAQAGGNLLPLLEGARVITDTGRLLPGPEPSGAGADGVLAPGTVRPVKDHLPVNAEYKGFQAALRNALKAALKKKPIPSFVEFAEREVPRLLENMHHAFEQRENKIRGGLDELSEWLKFLHNQVAGGGPLNGDWATFISKTEGAEFQGAGKDLGKEKLSELYTVIFLAQTIYAYLHAGRYQTTAADARNEINNRLKALAESEGPPVFSAVQQWFTRFEHDVQTAETQAATQASIIQARRDDYEARTTKVRRPKEGAGAAAHVESNAIPVAEEPQAIAQEPTFKGFQQRLVHAKLNATILNADREKAMATLVFLVAGEEKKGLEAMPAYLARTKDNYDKGRRTLLMQLHPDRLRRKPTAVEQKIYQFFDQYKDFPGTGQGFKTGGDFGTQLVDIQKLLTDEEAAAKDVAATRERELAEKMAGLPDRVAALEVLAKKIEAQVAQFGSQIETFGKYVAQATDMLQRMEAMQTKLDQSQKRRAEVRTDIPVEIHSATRSTMSANVAQQPKRMIVMLDSLKSPEFRKTFIQMLEQTKADRSLEVAVVASYENELLIEPYIFDWFGDAKFFTKYQQVQLYSVNRLLQGQDSQISPERMRQMFGVQMEDSRFISQLIDQKKKEAQANALSTRVVVIGNAQIFEKIKRRDTPKLLDAPEALKAALLLFDLDGAIDWVKMAPQGYIDPTTTMMQSLESAIAGQIRIGTAA